MKLTIDRKQIKEAVAGLSRIIPKRSSLPILGCVRIAADGNGCTLAGTDLEQTLAFKCASSATEDGVMIVPFETLNLLARGPDAEPVTFVSGRKKELTVLNTVAGQEIGRTFEVPDPGEWPAPMPAADVGPVDPAFLANFRRAALFASTEPSRLILNGVHLHVEGKEGDHLVATDGRRMAAFNSISLPLRASCVVPASKFLTWTKLVPDELLIGSRPEKDTGWFRLATPVWDYRCRTLQGTYPNWRMVVPGEEGAHQFTLGGTDAEMLGKVLPSFAGHDACNRPVAIELRDGRTFIAGKGENDRQPSRLELADSRSAGAPGRISVDRGYLLDALDAGFRVFRFADGSSPLTSRSEDGGIHVMMPLRTASPVPAASPVPEPAPETTHPEKKENPKMKEPTTTPAATAPRSALERVLEAYELAKARVREANDALALVATAAKDALKEDKARRQEIESVRSGLARLQQIKV